LNRQNKPHKKILRKIYPTITGTPYKQFFKGYEIEMAQVLGNLGTSIDKDTNRSEEHQAPTSSSNPIVDLPDIEMPFPKDTEQAEPHTEVNNPVE
jgi:hypothetical protein